jgi:hypothetical protein
MLTTSQFGSALAVLLFTGLLGAGASLAPRGVLESGQSAAASSIPPQSYEGVVTDTHCGAKHSAALGDAAAECTVRCLRAGEQFLLVDGDSSYLLEGETLALKRAAGQRVKIVGTASGGRISVTSVVEP